MRTPEEMLRQIVSKTTPNSNSFRVSDIENAIQEYADEYLKAFIKWADKSTVDSLYADPINPDNIINDFKESLKK